MVETKIQWQRYIEIIKTKFFIIKSILLKLSLLILVYLFIYMINELFSILDFQIILFDTFTCLWDWKNNFYLKLWKIYKI